MTDRPDPDNTRQVTDLLALLGQIPAEQTAQITVIGVRVLDVPNKDSCLDADLPPLLSFTVTTRRAGQVLADALGLAGPPTTEPLPWGGVEIQWSGPWTGRAVEISYEDCPDQPCPGPQDAQALTAHLTRLHHALQADPAAAQDTHTTSITTAGLFLNTHTTSAARALATRLCPHAPGVRREYWQAICEDTTVLGPTTPTSHHATEDLP